MNRFHLVSFAHRQFVEKRLAEVGILCDDRASAATARERGKQSSFTGPERTLQSARRAFRCMLNGEFAPVLAFFKANSARAYNVKRYWRLQTARA
jgi:hypothetical protein